MPWKNPAFACPRHGVRVRLPQLRRFSLNSDRQSSPDTRTCELESRERDGQQLEHGQLYPQTYHFECT